MTLPRLILLSALLGASLFPSPARAANAASEPFMVETKVQVDLENALSRLVPRELFLVQVNTDIGTRVERRLIEGETVTVKPEPTPPPPINMPGFLPEPDLHTQTTPPQLRELYRLVETPVLNSVIVRVTFDNSVTSDTVGRAKMLVQQYLREAYPNKSVVSFNQIEMLKPKKDDNSNRDVASDDDDEESPEEKMWNYARWGILAVLGIAILLLWTRQSAMATAGANRGGNRRPRPSPNPWDNSEALMSPGARAALENGLNRLGFPRLGATASGGADGSPEDAEHMLEVRRRKVLNRFLLKSEAFRIYYSRLDDEGKSELYAALNGPAYESLLDGLGLMKLVGEESDATRLDERLSHHEKQFEEFAAAKDWQDRQFFGFLHQLGDEQLMALVSHETPLAAALMLRHMKANQSASVLDALPHDRRMEILASAKDLTQMPLQKLASIEREVRAAAQKVPQHTFGSENEDITFWGTVLTESKHQDELMDELEKTHPDLAPKLTKYKFRLEDAATLPNNILERVLGDVENDELGMALATCSEDVVEVMLDAVSPRRRDMLVGQINNYRSLPANELQASRSKLTKRFREALG